MHGIDKEQGLAMMDYGKGKASWWRDGRWFKRLGPSRFSRTVRGNGGPLDGERTG
jgi:hypothetical protein